MTARLRLFVSKLAGLVRRGKAGREFDEELETHLALLSDRFVRQGLSPEEADRAARRQFGNVTRVREAHYEAISFGPLTRFLQDARYGARVLLRNPGWTLTAVLTLALGIGANVAIFSVVRPVLLDALPYPAADRLVAPRTVFLRTDSDRGAVSFADVIDWRRANLFERVSVYSPSSADLTGGDEPERVPALVVDDEYFRVMATSPLLGRFFTAEENLPNGPPVVVLGHGLWVRRFGASPSVINTRLEIRGVPHLVVGVARPNSTWPDTAELFMTIGTGGRPTADMLRRDNHVYQVIARLRPGVSLDRAQAQLTTMGSLVARLETNRSQTNWKLHGLRAFILGPTLPTTLGALFCAVAFILLIACGNVANLLLVRGAGREREIAIRAALGAGRARIAAQLLTETALLSAAGAVAGLAIGNWGLRVLVRWAPPDIPRLQGAHVDAGILLFTLGLSLLTTLVTGLVPAWHAARLAPGESFHVGGRAVSCSARAHRVRGILVAAELALAIVVVAGAGLLLRSFARIQRVDAGIQLHDVVSMQTSLPRIRYDRPAAISDGYQRILEAVRAVPGVTAASAATSLPLGGGGFYLGRVHLREGQPEPPASSDTSGEWCRVQPGYFATLGIPLVEGRDFTPRDTADSTPVVIISRSMAKEMFPDGGAVGKRIRSWRDENTLREIVGIAGDVHVFGLTDRITNNVYVPLSQATSRSVVLLVRTSGDSGVSSARIAAAVHSVDGKLPLADVRTLEQIAERDLARPRFSMLLLGVFGACATLLAAIGIYGVISYSVAQRTRELGIRLALGAARTRVLASVVWQAARLSVVGVCAGLVAAMLLTRLIESLLFEVSPTDPWTFGAATVGLLGVALAAALVPARRVLRVDPAITLRCE